MTAPRVSTPVRWPEIERTVAAGDARALRFSPADVLGRLEAGPDPFVPVLERRQPLPEP